MSEARLKGVFLFEEPNISKLKGCALFWKTIIVYEGFIQNLAFDSSEPTPIVFDLINSGVMKIVQTPEDLRSGLFDKIYAGLDETLWNYLRDNAKDVTVQPKLHGNVEEIISKSTEKDYRDKELMKLNDSIVHYRMVKQWVEGALESSYFPYAPPQAREHVWNKVKEIIEKQYKNFYLSRSERDRYNFAYRNKLLLEQLSLSSALCIESDWVPFYRRKLGDFSVSNAERYLDGLNVVVPFADRTAIADFSLDEIMILRKNGRWNNAMNRLAEICLEVKVESRTEEFKEELTNKVINEYQTALEEERMTKKKLSKGLGKKALYSGISLIPIIGPPISLAVGKIADPILTYLHKERKQRNLAFFLNDMRNLK